MPSNVNATIRYKMTFPTASITRPANTIQYTVGDVIANTGDGSHFEFTTVGGHLPLNGRVRKATLYSSANQATKLDANLFFFAADVTQDGDNAPWTPTDAELLTCVGYTSIVAANWVAGDITAGAGGNAMQSVDADIYYHTTKDSTTDTRRGILYVVMIADNTYTPVSGEVFTLRLEVEAHA